MQSSIPLGHLYGISVGTGDPELITLKGLRLLRHADVVAFPAGLHGKPGIAETIITPWLIGRHQQLLPLNFPYTPNQADWQQAWEQAAAQVWPYLHQGQDVAFACEGDVSFYSTFTYLAHTLQQAHPKLNVQTVPGISSPYAAAAALGIPLTCQGQKFVVLPALYTVAELEKVLHWADVVVLLKVGSVYSQVWQVLRQWNLLDRSWVVERATMPEQQVYDNLRDRPTLQLSYFSILIIHNKPLETHY